MVAHEGFLVPVVPVASYTKLREELAVVLAFSSPRSLEAVRFAVSNHGPLGLFPRTNSSIEDPTEAELSRVGMTAEVLREFDHRNVDGFVRVELQMLRKIEMLHVLEGDPFMRALVRVVESLPGESSATKGSAASPLTFRRTPDKSGEGWSPLAVDLYRRFVHDRLAAVTCRGCGTSLESARLVRTNTWVGPELNEYGLSDEGAARYLAATDTLVVECGRCGGHEVVALPEPGRSAK